MHDLEDVLERERLEVQAIGRVVVGRDGLGVAVDHDGLEPVLAQRERRMHAAVVELDALADPVGAAAEHDDLLAVGRTRLAFLFVRRVHVRRARVELGCARVDALVGRTHRQRMAPGPHDVLRGPEKRGEAAIGEPVALQREHLAGIDGLDRTAAQALLGRDEILDLRQEPRVDVRELVHFVERHPDAEGVGDVQDPLRTRVTHLGLDRIAIGRLLVETVDTRLEAAQGLLHGLLEGAAHGHHLADGLHLRREAAVGLRELLEGEPRDLRDDVVDRRLERRGRGAAGDVVLQFVERVTDGELRRHLRDRETGRLGGERRRTRHARIHLDDDHAAVERADRELHVRAAGVDADLAQDRQRGVAHDLVLLVRERLRRRDRDRVAGVDAHRIEVLDRADDDAVVLGVPDDLHLEFLPADQGLLDQEFLRRRGFETALADDQEFLAVVRDAAAGPAERERRPDDRRETDHRLHLQGFLDAVRDRGTRGSEADAAHGLLELLAILGLVDRLSGRADHLDAVLLEDAALGEVEGAVERRLATHRGQQGVGPLGRDDLLEHLPAERLDVRDVGEPRVGHDGRGVGVHQDDPVALLAQRLAGLGAGIVELARLPDDDGAGADDQDALDVSAFWHGTPP